MQRYRPDIDGLRALAVLPILLFHAGVSALPGGFVGVDVFFVISGFLITGIIDAEMREGRFSVLRFYRRRAVRIFPALFVTLAATVIAAVALLFPYEIAETSRSAAAAAAFLSNIFFWRTADYFAAAAETRPLLHTWSLGVEEQFYIVFPALLLVLRRWMHARLLPALWVITACSFALALWLATRSPAGAFYLIPARAWELGLGGLVALGGFPRIASETARGALAALGLALIATGVLLIRDTWSFPAPWALLPCAGSALLIAYGEGAATARLLRHPLLRGVGAISYSLYLWHWPIITFYRLRHGMELAPVDTVLLLAASFVAAILSYRLVEQPFLRAFRTRGRSGPIVAVSMAALAGVVAAALWTTANAARLGSVPPSVQRVLAYVDYPHWPRAGSEFGAGVCFSATGNEGYDPERCLSGRAGARNLMLVGDSTAAHYAAAIRARYPDVDLLQATASGCRPVLGATGLPRCVGIVRAGFDRALAGGVRSVVIAGLWEPTDVTPLARTVRALRRRGIDVLVVGPPVVWEEAFPRILARAILQHDLASIGRYRAREGERLDPEMRAAVSAAGGRYVSPASIECPGGRCIAFVDGNVPLKFDGVHLTAEGADATLARFPPL